MDNKTNQESEKEGIMDLLNRLPLALQELALNNPIVSFCLHLATHGATSYTDALERCVVELAKSQVYYRDECLRLLDNLSDLRRAYQADHVHETLQALDQTMPIRDHQVRNYAELTDQK